MRELLCPVLVGRDQEWRELRRALDRLADGLGATLVVAGEAGVGKSRLLREAAGEGVRRGARVLTGRAVGAIARSPSGPLRRHSPPLFLTSPDVAGLIALVFDTMRVPHVHEVNEHARAARSRR